MQIYGVLDGDHWFSQLETQRRPAIKHMNVVVYRPTWFEPHIILTQPYSEGITLFEGENVLAIYADREIQRKLAQKEDVPKLHGVVETANYQARKYGINSGLPMSRAIRATLDFETFQGPET